MRQPEEVRESLRNRFERDYPGWARNRGSWPLRLALRPPTTAQRSVDPVACHAWADAWRGYAGPGVIEYSNARFPTGTHPMPRTLVLHHPREVAAAHPDTQQTWLRCGHRLTTLQSTFPDARFSGIIRRITELHDRDYQRLIDTVAWIRRHPTSQMLLRQLPIEGIDTKWLAKHAHLVLALLGHDNDASADAYFTVTPSRLWRLHDRLGLRLPPELVQVTVLDPALRAPIAGMRHLAASISDLNSWPHHPDTVLILENKETAYAITDDLPGVVVLHGHGFNVAHYSQIHWVHTAGKVLYWGDIDAPGLQFLNDLRSHGITANAILMDPDTLDRFRHLAIDGAGPQRKTLPHLTNTEQELYRNLIDYAATHDTGLLLEQERIPWKHAYPTLIAAIRQHQPKHSGPTERQG